MSMSMLTERRRERGRRGGERGRGGREREDGGKRVSERRGGTRDGVDSPGHLVEATAKGPQHNHHRCCCR